MKLLQLAFRADAQNPALTLLIVVKLQYHHDAAVFVAVCPELVERKFDIKVSVDRERQPQVSIQPWSSARTNDENSVRTRCDLALLVCVSRCQILA